MSQTQDVTVHGTEGRGAREAATLVPAVDLYEDGAGVKLIADMPGVASDGLSVEVRSRELVIEGAVGVDMPDDMTARYAELRGGRYRRVFALSDDLDPDAIEASLKAGVLRVALPKKAAFQPRRITVESG